MEYALDLMGPRNEGHSALCHVFDDDTAGKEVRLLKETTNDRFKRMRLG